MREFKQCVERESIIFNVQVENKYFFIYKVQRGDFIFGIIQVKDPSSPVEFFINGELVVPNDRVEVKDLGEGKRQLIINKAEMGDNGTVTAKTRTNRGNEVKLKSQLSTLKF